MNDTYLKLVHNLRSTFMHAWPGAKFVLIKKYVLLLLSKLIVLLIANFLKYDILFTDLFNDKVYNSHENCALNHFPIPSCMGFYCIQSSVQALTGRVWLTIIFVGCFSSQLTSISQKCKFIWKGFKQWQKKINYLPKKRTSFRSVVFVVTLKVGLWVNYLKHWL